MKRYKKQLLVYILLIIFTGVFFYISIKIPDFQQPAQFMPNSSTLSPPHASIFAVVIQSFFGNYSANMTKDIIFFILFITAPFWIFSGYYFARKLNLPGIYNEARITKNQLIIIIIVCLIWGLFIPLISFIKDNFDSASKVSYFVQFSFISFSVNIIFELFLRLFLLSLIAWLFKIIFEKYIGLNKILWISSILTSILALFIFSSFNLININFTLFTNLDNSFKIHQIFDIISVFLTGVLLCRIYIKNGVIYSVITKIIIALLNTLIYLNIN